VTCESSIAETPHAWAGGQNRWDAYFATILLGTIAVVLAAGASSLTERLVAAGALVAMVPWYVFLGRRAMYLKDDGPHSSMAGVVYLTGLVPLLAVVVYCAGIGTFILLALCPQAFMAVSRFRTSVAIVVALNSIEVIVALVQRYPAEELITLGAVALLGVAFSITFGTWITGIIVQSAERAELIAQLEQTRADLADVNREAGMRAERDRLASEIHDTIAQGFTSIVMLVQAAESVIESDPGQARRQLGLIGRTARENLAEARALVADLSPAALGSGTLADAVARLTDRTGQELGISTEFAIDGEPRPLGTGIEVVLLRVGQEALTNVRKHAKANSVRVCLRFAAGQCGLAVTDDGVGFDLGQASLGYGLRGMRTRVAEIGGELDVCSRPGEGTTVTVDVR
jgi:signal transduction histidine kinase